MKWLVISPDLPYPADNGGRIRVYQLLQNLSERHEVHLLSFDRRPDEPDRVDRLRMCAEITRVPLIGRQQRHRKRRQQLRSLFSRHTYQYFNNHSPLMQQAIDTAVAQHRFDVIQVEFAQMGYYRFPPDVTLVLDQHNVESELLYRMYLAAPWSLRKLYALIEWRKFRREEFAICRRFPCCVTTSERDRRTLSAHAPATRFEIVPNGVDNGYFGRAAGSNDSANDILFVGTIDYHPNKDGLLHFLKNVFPRIRKRIPTLKFWIVGLNPPPEILAYGTDPAIEVTGRVEDVRSYYSKAAVIVVPLRIGAGTRLKILEALAAGRPVVSTTIGAEGIDVEHGKNIVLADDPVAFSDAVVQLMQDPDRRQRLAAAGTQLVAERYDWKSITARLERAAHPGPPTGRVESAAS